MDLILGGGPPNPELKNIGSGRWERGESSEASEDPDVLNVYDDDYWFYHLTDSDKQALAYYWTQGHKKLNDHYRKGEPISEEAQKYGEQLDKTIQKGVVKDLPFVWRGSGNFQFRVGEELTDNGFVSTSTSKDVALRFKSKNGYLIKINLPKKVNAARIQTEEKEILLGRGHKFKVVWVNEYSKEAILDLVE